MSASQALHPTDQTLHAYGLGQLEEGSAGSVDAHLEVCSACRRRVAELSSGSVLGRRDARPRPDSPAAVGSSLVELSLFDGGGTATAPPPAGPLPSGLAEHPDYEVIAELGRGGMGVVYLARNRLIGRPEVLKVVSGHHVERREVLDRFLREIRNAARLHHPNIVAAHSALRLGDSLVLAMEYAEGLDLARLVKTRGPRPVALACYYVHQAALGLQHAHEHGMVHRDIKPANLILAREGNKAVVKVLDFGLAKVTSEDQGDTSLTRVGQVLGTPDYIAPEQIRDAQSADIRADIYSLGCTFYYLLTGGPPFVGANLWDLYQAHFSMDASPLNLVRPEVPAELAALVAKMMAKEPGARFQTPGEVARALLPFIQGGNAGSVGSQPPVALAVQPETRPVRPAADRVPARQAPELATTPPPLPTTSAPPRPAPVRPALKKPPAPPPLPVNPSQPTRPATVQDSRIDLRDTNPARDGSRETLRAPVAGRRDRRDLRVWRAAIENLRRFGPRALWTAAGALLAGFVVIWASTRPTPPPPVDPAMEKSITNSIGMKFTLIPAGTFLMGLSPDARKAFAGAKAPVRVQIASSFYMGTYEVTRGQFRRFVKETGYATDAEKGGKGGSGDNEKSGTPEQAPRSTWRDPGFIQTDEDPVVNVSWNDAVAFAAWLSRQEGRTYRLPTEAEWEYACRAGSTGRYSFGDDDEGLAAVGNVSDGTARDKDPDRPGIAARDRHVHTTPVGRFRPNAFGLYDMHGNVWEWCSDDFTHNAPPVNDPTGPPEAQSRMLRGGSWDDEPRRCLSGAFVWVPRDYRYFDTGFRLVLVPSGR